jgi:hypothetical protein
MKARTLAITVVTLAARVGLLAAQQCPVPAASNEGKLLAFYAAPIAFTTITAPAETPAGSLRLAGELAYIPNVDTSLNHTGLCFTAKAENTSLSRVFPRPRLIVGLPSGLAVEVSYLPPVTVANATPNLLSAALSWTRRLSVSALLTLRAHGTAGSVSGPITCPSDAIQAVNDSLPCFAATGKAPSNDAFRPAMYGGEAAFGWTSVSGVLSAYLGGGLTAVQPSLRVNFTSTRSGQTIVDTTNVTTSMTRGAVFAGAAWRPMPALELGAQLYSVPSDLTTVRVSAAYRLRE